ncbi:MAG: M20/M25/M40 family metallo-hydrolase [Robiginitomaculum sp.]|nr:M20/M25/M40 family metallo-hydrolase [Robiginitomaculum sp.]
MKKILLGLLAALVVTVAIVVVRTVSLGKQVQNDVPLADLIEVDAPQAAANLSRAIRFKTVTMQNRADTDWPLFLEFQTWLKTTYPNFYGVVQSEQVLEYAQLNVWQGSDGALAPIVFLAHQDVVPASMSDGGWDYPPFDGTIADGFVYGRGAIDDKGSLIALLEGADRLAASGFKPKRTLIFAFGHDEEVAGRGADAISKLLEARGIKPYAVIDEGGAILTGMSGVPGLLASIGVAEKGYLTLKLTAKARGGHSSTPPEYTAIGALAKAITKIEASPFENGRDVVMTEMLRATAPRMPFKQRMAIANLWLFGPLVENNLRSVDLTRAMMGTSIAPTIIDAGFKENALPREAVAYINFRIHSRDSIESVTEHVRRVVDDENIEISMNDNIGSEPSPVSQIGTGPYLWLEEVINATFPDALVAPNTVVGGTDSRFFARNTDDIYRFAPYVFDASDIARIHGLNERMNVEAFAKAVQVYYLMVEKAGG